MGEEEESVEELVIIRRQERDEVGSKYLEDTGGVQSEGGKNYPLYHLLFICFHFFKAKNVPGGLHEGEEGQLGGQCIGSQWLLLAEPYPSWVPADCLFDLSGETDLQYFRDGRNNPHHVVRVKDEPVKFLAQ